MHDPDAPETREAIPDEPSAEVGDATLDGFEADLSTVESALDALDADDLDTAEAAVAGLSSVATPVADDD